MCDNPTLQQKLCRNWHTDTQNSIQLEVKPQTSLEEKKKKTKSKKKSKRCLHTVRVTDDVSKFSQSVRPCRQLYLCCVCNDVLFLVDQALSAQRSSFVIIALGQWNSGTTKSPNAALQKRAAS